MTDAGITRVVAPSIPIGKKAPYVVVGITLAVALQVGLALARYAVLERSEQQHVGAFEAPLEPMLVDPSWIIEGKPAFRAGSYAQSPDKLTSAGMWECDGPAKFRWEYSVDESLYVLEGGAILEYGGEKHTLGPGSGAFFPAGSTVVWTVSQRVRKTFSMTEPGRFKRLLRKAFAPAPPH
jgi:uncharacterized cupin superfamily protein